MTTPKKPTLAPLSQLGLTRDETATYLALLQLGPQRASVLAAHQQLPRTTMQNLLLRLERQHIVTKAAERGSFIFAAANPESLVQLAEMRRRAADAEHTHLIGSLRQLAPELTKMMRGNREIPHVKFFTGKSGVRDVLYDTLTSKTELRDYANIDAMFAHVRDINDAYVAEREKTKLKKRSLLLDTPFAREVYESGSYSPKSHAGYKWINAELYPFALEMNIYDNRVSYITYVKNDFVGVIIHNEHIYRMHDSMWRLAWDLLPEVK